MLIEVKDNLFINAKNISYVRIKKNHVEFTELENDHLEDFEISNKGEKELREFFNFDEDFIEISFSSYQNEAQYINVRAISRVSIDDNDDDGDVILDIKFINDAHPYSDSIQKEEAMKTISEIRKKIARIKYVDHF